jgi:parvulin-like peptidyl-prolyl isomerase
MNLTFQIGDSRISGARILSHLQGLPLMLELQQEMAIDEIIERLAGAFQLDLTPTASEFDSLVTQISQISSFQGMNPAQIAAITTRSIRLQKFKQAGWGDRVASYYQTVRHQLDRVTYSILLVADPLLAQELFFRIQSGEQSFAELAIEYSQDQTAINGGLVGPIPVAAVPPAIAQILLQLTAGGLSPLFQLDGCYGLIRLNQLVSPELDHSIYQLLLDELFDNWIHTQLPVNIADNLTKNQPLTTTIFEPNFNLRAVSKPHLGSE